MNDATMACELTRWEDPGPLAVVAAAYDELGDFPNEIKRQKAAIQLVSRVPDAKIATLQKQLQDYEASEPGRNPKRTDAGTLANSFI